MNSTKVEMITNWKSSQNVHNIQAFLKFANFYQQFIQYFLKIVWFLVNLIKKIMKFLWNITCKYVFNNLKKQFIIVLIFIYFDSDFECLFKINLFNHTQKDVLSQYNKNDVLHSIVFFSQKLNAVESNYKIYDKKLLTIIWYFE